MMLMEPVLTNSKQSTDCTGQARSNTTKNQNRNTITQTALGDLLTQPHQKHGSGS
jgi:hypothetical protein